MRISRLLFVLSLSAACAAPATAKPVIMLNLWRAATPELQRIGSVAKGQAVIRQRLLPTGLVAADSDVIGETGSVLFAAGSEFFELASEGLRGWCSASPMGVRGVPEVQRNPPRHRCLADDGDDLTADAYFEIAGTTWALPTIFARLPKKRVAIRPVPLRKVEPERGRDQYWLEIVFGGVRPITGRPMFMASVGSPGYEQLFVKDADWHGPDKPVALVGTSLMLASANARAAEIIATKPIPEKQMFSAMQTLQIGS